MKKTVLITGASSGIGEALAYKAAKTNCNVSLIARNKLKLEAVADACKLLGAEVEVTIGDVSQPSDCLLFINNSVARFGKIDVLINNAGISMRSLFVNTDIEVLKKLMDINFWGMVYCTKYALPELLKSGGSVVGVSSIAGFKGLPGRTGYSASKFAMNGFLESLRNENYRTPLHVLVACPGYTSSNIRKSALNGEGLEQEETPLDESKLMAPEEVAEQIWNAIEKRRKYLILTFTGKVAIWANKLWPGLADWMAYNYVRREPGSPFT